MLNSRPKFALPLIFTIPMLFFASITTSEAQTNFTPPPIPVDETVVVAEEEIKPSPEDEASTPPPPPPPEAVAPPPPPPADEIFVSIDGSSEGPFTVSELEARLAAGTFSSTAYVWEEGMADWTRADEVEKLSALFADTQRAIARPEPKNEQTQGIETYLAGIWVDKNATFIAGLGQVQMDMLIEYYPDGRMDGIGRFTATNNGTSSVYDVYIEGTWNARATVGNGFDLTTVAQVSTGLVESPVYTDTFDLNETISHQRLGPNSFRDVENNLTYARQ